MIGYWGQSNHDAQISGKILGQETLSGELEIAVSSSDTPNPMALRKIN